MKVATGLVLITGGMSAYPWQTNLKNCWTDVTCRRALVLSHGGSPNYVTRPYDSKAAFVAAFNEGADAVKGDFRVTSDNVGMVMHSSPVQIYESLNCFNKKVEEMTEAAAKKCMMLPTTERFMSAAELLDWAEDKVITMFCVKEAADIPRAISTLIEQNATHRSFLEIRVGELQREVLAKRPAGWDQVYYLAEMGAASDVDTVLSDEFAPLLPRLFTFEFDPSWPDWDMNVTDVIANRLHPAGVRSFAATKTFLPTTQQHIDLYNAGFDVVYTYGTGHAVDARTQVNEARGIDPTSIVV